jgi:Ca-activated chloride channel family protein
MNKSLLVGVLLIASGCSDCNPRKNELRLIVAYGSEKKTWLDEQARKFEATGPKTASGKSIVIEARALGSGEATQAILAGTLKPHVFSPASSVYLTLLNDAWTAKSHGRALAPAGDPIVLSPIVIAMWKPMAEVLGWPARALGWSDLIRVSTSADGWGALGHPEWGRFKLGHTHPEYSSSGLLSVLAEAYAGAQKTRQLAAADLDAATTQSFIAAVEKSIVHYGKSTGLFADKMVARGPAYLSAAVLYENLVIESYARTTPLPIVAIYPREGTFWADHPYAILDGEWVGDEERKAAELFLAFLKARPQQERALALGFRPADPAIATSAPIDAAHGCDVKQPQTLLEVPGAATLDKLLAVWRTTKRPSDVILVFDKSGSMTGAPLAQAKLGARSFLEGLHDRDQATLIPFDETIHGATGPVTMPDGRRALISAVDEIDASGGTALYDAIAAAYQQAEARAQADPARIHTVVVMTDGKDEDSHSSLKQLEARLPREGERPIKIFTIAYGDDASDEVLREIAAAADGASAKGGVGNIVQVFQDMASFF